MLTKAIMFTLLAAACGANPNSATEEPEKEPPDEIQEDQHFCCQSVSPNSPSGEGCQLVPKEYIAQCQKILYCESSWTMDDGKVTCHN
ncbi:hypothetical protein [Enhygromyxa salina]|uniref:Lipoprotein n=1 Tax=Enhygromyxa salina TaxID=215803 RepID=A0A2S9YIB8_9BACT|nr:hypothetical protein [Enhygromyxa salina]PRQ04858.1 hypothetical protein ENSA7_50310 [Enhygromyxa salina]